MKTMNGRPLIETCLARPRIPELWEMKQVLAALERRLKTPLHIGYRPIEFGKKFFAKES